MNCLQCGAEIKITESLAGPLIDAEYGKTLTHVMLLMSVIGIAKTKLIHSEILPLRHCRFERKLLPVNPVVAC